MLKSLYNLFLQMLLLFSTTIVAQVNDSNYSSKTDIASKEKEQVLDAFDILNRGDEKAYVIGHQLRKKARTHFAKINAHLLLAHYFKNRTLSDSSNFYVKAFMKLNTVGNDSLICRRKMGAYNLLAINYGNKGLVEESKKWHQKGIILAKKYNEEEDYFIHLHGLAVNYVTIGDLNQALRLFKECLTYNKHLEITMGSYINIGQIYADKKDFETSDLFLKKGLKLAKKHQFTSAITTILLNLASNAQILNKTEDALMLYERVVEIASKHKFYKERLNAEMNIGNILINTEQFYEAELIYSLALANAIEYGYLDQQLIIYDNLKEIAKHKSDYEKVYYFSRHYFAIKDSISQLQRDKEINELEVKYQTLQKEKEISILQIEKVNRDLELANQKETIQNLELQREIEKKESENELLSFQNATEKTINENSLLRKNQEIKEAQFLVQQAETKRQKGIKNIILYSFLIFLIPIIGLLYTYYLKLKAQNELNKKQEEVNEQKIASILKDQELKLVKASIKGQNNERERIAQELHDSIGGNIAGIKLQLNNSDNSDLTSINLQIDDTYKQVRDLSHNLIPKKFSENNFCNILREYLNNILKGSSIASNINAYPVEEIDLLDENLQAEIFKIIQELITNTIKHAKASIIEIQINLVDNVLGIIFEDNGIGFDVKKQTNGIGFKNMKNRLKKISGVLNIDSNPKIGTIISIEISNLNPLINEV
ncbi:tetratricopeptide repeat-containing sensor histidine kinase [Flavivirga spongiicola]|uniref:histidine kinase n=1 Tax=Flavivirga spongiicola TaxID=421621 RepID=A0ABU7XUC8_9FLAO|nr:tetratricopeptide repeat-containing sensor histidine kinase [Flavivirga sp. MEBiC05379]MDO5979112.1 histidine kinase [Flavivirga sp. MEBiC05379]